MDTDEQLPPPNLAARMAVWATKRGHGSTIGKPVIFLLLILCWFSLTSLGAWQASPEPDVGRRLADALYAPFTFLAPQDSYLNQTESALLTDPLLWFGRFFGAAIPVYAIVWAAIAWGRRRMAHALLPLARGHVILFSEPGEGDGIARRLTSDGEVVIQAEREPSPERIEAMGNLGIILIDAKLPTALRQSNAEKASRLVVWGADDADNLARALKIGELLTSRHEDILVRIESAQMHRAMRLSRTILTRDDARLRPLSLYQAAVREVLADADLTDAAHHFEQEGVHVGIIGHSRLLEEVATFVLRHNWSVGLAPPRITIDPAYALRWEGWFELHRQAFDAFPQVLGKDAEPVSLASGHDTLINDPTLTRIIIDLEDDGATVEAVFRIGLHLWRAAALHYSIQPVTRSTHSVRALYREGEMNFEEPISLALQRHAGSLMSRQRDRAAARKHLTYEEGLPDVADLPANKPWRHLDETYVHASRAAAEHDPIKKSDLARLSDSPAAQEKMRRNEHERWSVERLLDGWLPTADRAATDPKQLLHRDLVPWEELEASDKEKDAAQVDALIAQTRKDES